MQIIILEEKMDEYRKILILQYFFEKKEKYNINEISVKLGIGYIKILSLIESLLEMNMLIYNNYLLEITDLGRQSIQKNDIYIIYNNDIINIENTTSEKINIDDIYIPKRFSKKI